MAHPFSEHKGHKVERSRVGRITSGYASGGAVHQDEAADRSLIRKEVKSSALKTDGGKSKSRSDKSVRRAKGGRVKHGKSGKTNINVIVAPSGDKPPMNAPMAGAPPMPAMPPRPPMAPPSPPAAMAPPQAGLGGLPPRAKGGRVSKCFGDANMSPDKPNAKGDDFGSGKPRADGGKVEGKKSLADKKGVTGISARTPIQHSGNKNDTQNIGRGAVVTRAAGGPIYSNGKPGTQMAPKLPAGSGSGVGRAAKNKIARRQHWDA